MLEPAEIAMTIYQGVDYYWVARVCHDDGTYLDTANHTATFRVYANGDYRSEPVVDLTSGNGGAQMGVGGLTLAETTLAGAAGRGAESITVASGAGIADGDAIDVFLDDGAVFPTHVAGAPEGNAITLAHPLPGIAAAGNTVKVHDPARFGMYNLLLYMGKAATAALTPWGHGRYVLDLADPFGHELRLAQHTCVLQEGD